MPMMVSERHHHRHSIIYTIMDGIGFALCSGGMPSINGRIVYGHFVTSDKTETTVNIGVSWDYGIILTAHHLYNEPSSNLRYPIYFIPGTNKVVGPMMTYNDGTWSFGTIDCIYDVTESSFKVSSRTDLYFILISYV